MDSLDIYSFLNLTYSAEIHIHQSKRLDSLMLFLNVEEPLLNDFSLRLVNYGFVQVGYVCKAQERLGSV